MFLRIITIFLALSLLSCNQTKKIIAFDKEAGLTKSEFKNNLLSEKERINDSTDQTSKETIPELSQILMAPQPPQVANDKIVSLSVTEDIPIKDVLVELGRLADIEIQIDPEISGGIIFITKDRPFTEVIDKIADLANLRYSIDDGILKVTRDMPYALNYPLDFLDIVRSNTSSLQITTKTGTDDLSSGGDSSIDASSEGDLWGAVLTDIEQMLDGQDSTYVTSNKQAGIVTISATQKQHRTIAKYLDNVRRNATAQVLIEAKIVEVTLNDSFSTGIDWTQINKITNQGTAKLTQYAGTTTNAITLPFQSDGNQFASTMTLLKDFGTTRTLSSPRITALNNQQAVLTFSENKVYFTVEYSDASTTATGGGTTTTTGITSELKTVPIGIILTLQPSINLQKEEVTMMIRPTISTSNSVVADPAVSLIAEKQKAGSTIKSEIPVVQIKELDTMLRLKNTQSMVIGGLIEQVNSNQEAGVPFFKDIPVLGYLFKSSKKLQTVKETVIFIKATIINTESAIDKSDRNFYKKFTTDPRPLIF